ncbi:hypothetical protein OUZ56_028101 [Daphnia magna]|uniref:C2H2-type domain-containing protein n=1 Tax=Daphnia magna TaxID=35525 RepID=A0ABR0B2W2_9CRUS|nr:hypothetical protein OUZ56_028101 [Daphnia magna]
MPKSFLFTHRRYNISPVPTEEAASIASSLRNGKDDVPAVVSVVKPVQQPQRYIQQQHRKANSNPQNYPAFPLSPGQGTVAELKSPGRPQSARISPVIGSGSIMTPDGRLQHHGTTIPEEMYNLFQLAEVSLATSGGSEFRSVLERWRHQQQGLVMARALKSPVVKMLDMSSCSSHSTPVLDKPLDLSRDPATTATSSEVRILTPSPSPTPSETHLTINLGLRKKSPQSSRAASSEAEDDEDDDEDVDELDATDSCWSPDDVTSCKSVSVVVKGPSASNSSNSGDSHTGPDGHECPDCGKRYSTSSNLARHRQTHRSPADQKARRCPHCDKVYVSVPAFSMHVRTHSQGCKCPYCGKSFSRPWLLQGHIRTHTGEKPFTCQICEKAFADKSNLRAHIQTHSNLKPFTCQRCGKAFALKSYLYKHEESSCMKMVTKGPAPDPKDD